MATLEEITNGPRTLGRTVDSIDSKDFDEMFGGYTEKVLNYMYE